MLSRRPADERSDEAKRMSSSAKFAGGGVYGVASLEERRKDADSRGSPELEPLNRVFEDGRSIDQWTERLTLGVTFCIL